MIFQSYHPSFVTESKLALLTEQQANKPETGCWEKGGTLLRELTDGDVSLVPQNNHLVGAWMPGSFTGQRWGGRWGNKVKRPSLSSKRLLKWQVLGSGTCFTSLQPFTHGQGQAIFLRQAIMYAYSNKRGKTKNKFTEADPVWIKNYPSLVTPSLILQRDITL